MRRIRRFFLEPRDSHTNEVLARTLESERSMALRWAQGGRPRKVYEVTNEELQSFLKSKTQAHLDFNVWSAFEEEHMKRWYPHAKKNQKIIAIRRRLMKKTEKLNLRAPELIS